MNTKHQTTIEWHPFPETKPGRIGEYLAGNETATALWWRYEVWKKSPNDNSNILYRIKWWAEMPVPPKEDL